MTAPAKQFNLRRGLLATLAASAALLLAAAPASADLGTEFGLGEVDVAFSNSDGSAATQAGSHPYEQSVDFGVNYAGNEFEADLYGEIRDVAFGLPEGFVGDSSPVPFCPNEVFGLPALYGGECPKDSQVGEAEVIFSFEGFLFSEGLSDVYMLEPPPGKVARFGYRFLTAIPIIIDVGINEEPPYNLVASSSAIPQLVPIAGNRLDLWGNPPDPSHDAARGGPSEAPESAFLTAPAACTGPLTMTWETDSWQNPGTWASGSVLTHDSAEPPNPQGFTGCGKVPFDPRVTAQPTSKAASSGSGLDFDLDFAQEGLLNPDGLAQSTAKRAEVTLPEGVTINPSIGEGLGFCSPADFDSESLAAGPGEGCPESSKIGTVFVESPLLDDSIGGSVYLAQQGDPDTAFKENPFDSLIALYLVIQEPKLGISIKLPAKVEPDPNTGRLVTIADDLPQLPFSHFNFHFREGLRPPLVMPPTCGSHDVVSRFTPWSDPANPRTIVTSFEIEQGVNGGACPAGGVPPFSPEFEAGSANNNAGSFSPFDMRLIRHDGEQDMTKFGAILPPGVVGSLRGVEKCSEAAIAAARAKTGRQEQAAPSCPSGSLIGHTRAGAGVGSALTYVPGEVHLAGPYKGAPLSVVSITPAVAGPFDAGNVVVRIALDLNPRTAEVEVDGASSDPIPHILKGIPLTVRDLQVFVDRSNFTLNPTSCDESSARGTLFGSFLNVLDPADDVPVDLSTRYQAANCLNLGFAPKLGLRLKGENTRRGGHPGLRAVYSPSEGQANVEDLVVRLPRSAFLDQSHIRTICTRVQFAADECPNAARYGYIKAWTPLLDEPLQGPVWLRSSDHKLPDLVFDLHGLVDVEVATRLDSIRGGIRAKVEDSPDAPISRVVLNMQGGKKGLIVNSRDLCMGEASRASAQFDGHNGKRTVRRPAMRPQCGRKAKRAGHSRRARVATRSAVR
jgi:hypothetical protein